MKQPVPADRTEPVTEHAIASPTFKPSEVSLVGSFPPFVATFKRSEAEMAAALLVRTMAETGDEWRAVALPEIAKVLKADVANKLEPWLSFSTNPFFRPDFLRLVSDGFCDWKHGGDAPVTDPERLLEFTVLGLDALRRWVRPIKCRCAP